MIEQYFNSPVAIFSFGYLFLKIQLKKNVKEALSFFKIAVPQLYHKPCLTETLHLVMGDFPSANIPAMFSLTELEGKVVPSRPVGGSTLQRRTIALTSSFLFHT